MSFFEFPNTRTYDSDLGWIIRTVKELTEEYTNLLNWMNTHKGEYTQLEKRVANLENRINSFESEMNRRFENLSSELKREISVDLDNALQQIHRELNEALAQINTSLGNIRGVIDDLQSDLVRTRLTLNGRIVATEESCKLYTDIKIQQLINDLPDLTTINVFNPVVGYITNIQTAINDIYDLSRTEGLRASEYDNLGLTAAEYDALELTALQYDQMGRYYLELAGYIKNPYHYMNSPFTGNYVTLQTVISELAALHKVYALTAEEYDDKELTASDYDALLLGAYDYDWHGKQLIA